MTPINKLAESFTLSDETAALQHKLNGRIDAHNACVAKLTIQVGEIESADLIEVVDKKFAEKAETIMRTAQGILGAELKLRLEMREYWAMRHSDLQQVVTDAEDEHHRVQTKVEKLLRDIGYTDLIPGTETPCLQPGFLFRHPAVFAANHEAGRLRRITNDVCQQSEQRIHAIEGELSKVRDKLIRMAGL